MKKIISYSIISVSALLFSGCAAISTWWNGLSLTDVAKTLSPTLSAAAKYSIYAVCDKNPDLKPIFIASANGVKLALAAEAYDVSQIKAYILLGLGEENEKWAGVVYSALDTILAQYEIIYNKYINEKIEDNDKLNGFKILLTSIMDGIINGASMEDLSGASGKPQLSIDQKRIEANANLVEAVSKY